MSPLAFGAKKCSKRPTSRIPEKFVFFSQTASEVPQPLDLLTRTLLSISVFAKIHPAELVTVCHRYVTAPFWAEKVPKNGQLPDFPKTSFFTQFSGFFRPSTAACQGLRPCPDNLPNLSPSLSPGLTRQPARVQNLGNIESMLNQLETILLGKPGRRVSSK